MAGPSPSSISPTDSESVPPSPERVKAIQRLAEDAAAAVLDALNPALDYDAKKKRLLAVIQRSAAACLTKRIIIYHEWAEEIVLAVSVAVFATVSTVEMLQKMFEPKEKKSIDETDSPPSHPRPAGGGENLAPSGDRP